MRLFVKLLRHGLDVIVEGRLVLSEKGKTIRKWTASKEYIDGWERIFRKKKEGETPTGDAAEDKPDGGEENLDSTSK